MIEGRGGGEQVVEDEAMGFTRQALKRERADGSMEVRNGSIIELSARMAKSADAADLKSK